MPNAAAAAEVSCSSVTTWSLIRTARTERPLRCASAAAASTRPRIDADLLQRVQQRAEGLVHNILSKRYVRGTPVPSDTSADN